MWGSCHPQPRNRQSAPARGPKPYRCDDHLRCGMSCGCTLGCVDDLVLAAGVVPAMDFALSRKRVIRCASSGSAAHTRRGKGTAGILQTGWNQFTCTPEHGRIRRRCNAVRHPKAVPPFLSRIQSGRSGPAGSTCRIGPGGYGSRKTVQFGPEQCLKQRMHQSFPLTSASRYLVCTCHPSALRQPILPCQHHCRHQVDHWRPLHF